MINIKLFTLSDLECRFQQLRHRIEFSKLFEERFLEPFRKQHSDATPSTRTKRICKHCSGENVVRDAWASFNPDTQSFELHSVFDHTYCMDCEGETEMIEEGEESC